MKKEELKKLIISTLSEKDIESDALKGLEEAGLNYSFSDNFTGLVIDRIFSGAVVINRENEFTRSLNNAFYRIALTGVAAILLLLISIYVSQGTLSVDSFFGIISGADESIVVLLTGS